MGCNEQIKKKNNFWTCALLIFTFICFLFFSNGKKYCCVPGCSKYTSDKLAPDGSKIILRRLPLSEKKSHIKKLWIQRLRNVRANLIVNDHTRVCSAYFDGPFTHESIPTIFPSKPMKKETTRRQLIRKDIHSDIANTDMPEIDDNETIANFNSFEKLDIVTDKLKIFTSSFTQTEIATNNASTCTSTWTHLPLTQM